MRRAVLVLIPALAAAGAALAAVWACSSPPQTFVVDAGDAAPPPFGLAVGCTDLQDDVYADPAASEVDLTQYDHGGIIKCFKDEDIAMADLKSALNSGTAYTGQDIISGARVYRIMYKTQRGDPKTTQSYATATVYLPDTPRAPQLPAIAAVHAMTGIGPNCAPSKFPTSQLTSGPFWGPDYVHLVYPLVGSGYVVIAPDLPGFANYGKISNPPLSFGGATDMAFSTIDAVRAIKGMFNSGVSDQTVLVGAGLGSAAALSALSNYSQYGTGAGTPVGVAVYQPMWFSPRRHASLFGTDAGALQGNGEYSLVVWYHWTHGELLDGVGHGQQIFQEAGVAAVKKFVDRDCFAADYPELTDAGFATLDDLFDPAYAGAISTAVQAGADCNATDAGDLCKKWLQRMDQDRPALGGQSARVPVFIAYGGRDPLLTPDWAMCAFNRLKDEGQAFTVCFDPDKNGSGMIATKAGMVNDLIASWSLDGGAPDPCFEDQSGMKGPEGGLVQCNPAVPNQ